MDIWLVSRGAYSDYRVCAAFTTRADARRWLAETIRVERAEKQFWNCYHNHSSRFYNDYQVERMDLDPVLPSVVKAVQKLEDRHKDRGR